MASLPLDAYTITGEDYANLQRAAWQLIEECVTRFGGRYTLDVVAASEALEEDELGNSRRYGVYNSSDAQEYGYHSPLDVKTAPSGSNWNPTDSELILVRGEVPSGITRPLDENGLTLPEGGCQREADAILTGGDPKEAEAAAAAVEQVNVFSSESFLLAESDSRVQAAVSRWRDCMSGQGFIYDSPRDATNDEWSEAVTEREVATATADVECKEESNYVGTFYAVESAYQVQQIEEAFESFDSVKEFQARVIRESARVLS